MTNLLTPLVQLLDSFDLCSGFILAMTLHVVGTWCCHSKPDVQHAANKFGVGVFLILLLAGLLRDGYLYLLLARMALAGALAWMTASTAKVVLPAVGNLTNFGSRQSRSRRSVFSRRKTTGRLLVRQEKIREATRRKQAAEWDAGREEREAAAAEASRQALEEEDRLRDEQDRREVARFDVRLLFDRHAAEIRTSMPRKRFDEYLTSDLSDKYPAELVERRAEQMKQTILDFFESREPEQHLTTEAIGAHYEAELDRVTNLDLDDKSKAAMRSELHFAWERAKRTGKIR